MALSSRRLTNIYIGAYLYYNRELKLKLSLYYSS